MKKITFLLLGLLLTLPAAAQMQKGYVKTRGRLAENGAVIPGKRLAGAFVKVRGRQGVRSNAQGNFSLPVDKNFYVERAELAGYTVADRDLLSRRYDYSAGNPLIVVLEKPDTQLQDKLTAERKIRRTLRQQLDKREAELDELRAAQRITQARYDSLLRALYEDQSKSEQLIANMAERYASIDFDQKNDLNRRISACILNGELERADSLLRTKGDIHERAAALQRHRDLNDAEAEELARRQENLDQSRRLEAHDLEELAADCYHRYELCLVEHRNDSAAYYLRFRAALDTTNVEWALDAGNFIKEYQVCYDDVLFFYNRALWNAREQNGEKSELVACCYGNIGNLYSVKEQYKDALDNYNLSLDIYKIIFGEYHPVLADSYMNIANVYRNQFRYDDALKIYLGALYSYKIIYDCMYPKMVDFFEKTNADSANVGGYLFPRIACCYYNIGSLYNDLRRYDDALKFYLLAVDFYKFAYGEHHTTVADCYLNMCRIYRAQSHYDDALKYDTLALGIYKYYYGEHHPKVAGCYGEMGNIHLIENRYDDALDSYNQILEIYESSYGRRSSRVADSYYSIGLVYDNQNFFGKALENYSLALDIYKSVYSNRHPKVADCYYSIGLIYGKQEIYSECLKYFEQALPIYKETLPAADPQIMNIEKMINAAKSAIAGNR